MDTNGYSQALATEVDRLYQAIRDLPDHRHAYPWLTSSLGDPASGIWFVAENPSLTQVERARDPGGGAPTEEAQWYTSRGDKLLREALVLSGFKTPPIDAPGGWRCYITNLIKQPAYVEDWKRDGSAEAAALRWAPILRWQLAHSRPRLVVFMGRKVARLAKLLAVSGVDFPATMMIEHYSYVAMRPRGRQGPMHPERIAEYFNSFRQVRQRFESLAS